MTREEAIKCIQEEKLRYERAPWVNSCPMTEEWQKAIDICDMALSALRVQQEQESKPLNGWISVKDRLPEVGGYVVCIAKRNPFSRFMPMVARIEKNGWVNPMTEQYISEVTNWMPLPEPPKEG